MSGLWLPQPVLRALYAVHHAAHHSANMACTGAAALRDAVQQQTVRQDPVQQDGTHYLSGDGADPVSPVPERFSGLHQVSAAPAAIATELAYLSTRVDTGINVSLHRQCGLKSADWERGA